MKVTKDILRPTLILVAITLIVSAIVVVVYNFTKMEEPKGMSPEALAAATTVMGTDQFQTVESNDFTENIKGAVKTAEDEYAINVISKGYSADGINLVVGLDKDGKVKGVAVVKHAETNGIGTKALTPEFFWQFNGKSGEIAVGSNVDAVAGATVTSSGVAKGVNEAVQAFEAAKKGKVGGTVTGGAVASESSSSEAKPKEDYAELSKKALTDGDTFVLADLQMEGMEGIYIPANKVGLVVHVMVTGYNPAVPIDMLIGIGADGTIKGFKVVANAETEGLGELALKKAYLNHFVGSSDGAADKVDAVAGATVSSDAVKEAVKIAFAAFEQGKELLS